MRDIQDMKVGDLVVCIGQKNKSKAPEGRSSGWKKGLCFEIRSVSNIVRHFLVAFPKGNLGVYYDQLRFATDEEISEYNRLGKPNPYIVKQVELPRLEDLLEDLDKRIEKMEKKQHGKVRV